ncbi:hypothetical protein [Rathayibacter tritici]|uniref:hypothetical protein n=1 Tax=Rathayibacter tritici TaxID=33888 RepID=UPI0011AFDB49|nr:hypothetical protein [Rathayibacter tritici]
MARDRSVHLIARGCCALRRPLAQLRDRFFEVGVDRVDLVGGGEVVHREALKLFLAFAERRGTLSRLLSRVNLASSFRSSLSHQAGPSHTTPNAHTETCARKP